MSQNLFFLLSGLPRKVRKPVLSLACGALLIAMSACTTQMTVHASGTPSGPLKTKATPAEEVRLAKVALDHGDLDMARTIYERLIATNPDSVEGLVGLGDTLYAVGDFTRAGVLYDRAHQLAPEALEPMINRGRIAIRERRFDQAIQIYREVLAKLPNNSLAAAGLGTALDMSGDHAGAQAVLREAMTKNPGDPYLATNLGMSLLSGGDVKAAIAVLLDVTRFPAAPPQAREDLALAYGMLGNDKIATELLAQQNMNNDDVKNNLKYYEYLRTHRGYQTMTPTGSAGVISSPLTQMHGQLTETQDIK
ncbi:tetratricopeptide repeat protein [Robbsia sp. KACC 23696]|uniref:tetratricopeptide repeat protein n=1 Tax=Robbsia sp. KACC 23696 TaxID=3149231 RepID=UPI00325C2D63